MPSLCLLTPATMASLRGERLVVEVPSEEQPGDYTRAEVPLRDVDSVVITENVAMTMPALAECLRREIPVLMTWRGERVIGICIPPAPHCAARLAQYGRVRDPEYALGVAAAWVAAKISNERRVLQRLASNRAGSQVRDALDYLEQIARRCPAARSVETLRGHEGTAAGTYFEALARFFPEDCPFERRSRRPPHNPANAVLSYAYTILGAEIECQILAAGLDPCLGFLHETEDRRASLALDILEPFRAPVADGLALDLLGHGTLRPESHFESRDGGVFLNDDGRKRFFVAYERRMNREFLSEQHGRRTTLRNELRHETVRLKQAIVEGTAFEPFAMN